VFFVAVFAACYFPFEVQGTYLVQTQASAAYGGSIVTYSELTIEVDAIPPWGRCHLKRGNNVIVKDSAGAEDCLRCFHLTLKTPNVIQIHTEGLGRCYTNEEAARATCPDDKAVFERRFKEIILYRKQDPEMVSTIQNIFCPINGRYHFTYTANNKEFQCTHPFSEVSNCPHGNGLGVQFRQCNFPDMSVQFLCLGDWEGPNKDRYLALMDLRPEPEGRPKYRCGHPKTPSVKCYVFCYSGESFYNCVWLQRRSHNIVEMMLGSTPSSQFSEDLCRDEQFQTKEWITQGKVVVKEATSCPITGDYTGVVPDTTGLCAKVASDCNNPDVMFYSVSSCSNKSHVYEERVYRCIGNWEESGALFTYTRNKVGKVVKNGDEAYIKEAGESCARGKDLFTLGMKIIKQVSCPQVPVTFIPVRTQWRPALTPPSQDIAPSSGDNGQPTTPPRKSEAGQPNQGHSVNSCKKVIPSLLRMLWLLLIVKCVKIA
ncbi:uncharacterized protein LOC106474711, partial [Limulus polyphemus]|uniref:Uncharacterized protein LOC106474711 n=1 Tax=Limulus polyphemus TaxID=6850 RepID=A0ABM1TS65_LIMPO